MIRASREGDPSERSAGAARRRRRAWLASLLVALAACHGGSEHPPNIVIITLDTTRADHLGLYGYFRDTSPTLDAFAKQAIVFDRAIVPMAMTLPTHTSFLTALHPLEHGVLGNSAEGGARFVLPSRILPLAEVARAAGWRTAAIVSATPLKRGSGIEKGFEYFNEPQGPRQDGQRTTDAALAWLAGVPVGPFLLWVHYFDAHTPFTSPTSYMTMFSTDPALEAMIAERKIPRTAFHLLPNTMEDTRASINLYDGELRYQDDQLARLLAALEARPDWDRTAVVIAGDHGEGLGEHGEAAHGGTWNEQLHAPLIMRIPGATPGRITTLVTAADLIPTLLGHLDAPALAPVLALASGRDVLAEGARSLPVLSVDSLRKDVTGESRSALTSERWKFYRVEREDGGVDHLLFDLVADPFELTDVAAQHPVEVKQLDAALQVALDARARTGFELRGGKEPTTTPADPETVEQLRALGYVVDEAPRPGGAR